MLEGERQAGRTEQGTELGEMRTREREELIFVEGLLRANTENGNDSSDPAAWGLQDSGPDISPSSQFSQKARNSDFLVISPDLEKLLVKYTYSLPSSASLSVPSGGGRCTHMGVRSSPTQHQNAKLLLTFQMLATHSKAVEPMGRQ